MGLLTTVALTGSILSNDPSAGLIKPTIVSTASVHQIKGSNDYEGLLGLQRIEQMAKDESPKVNMPHVLQEDPAPAPKPAPKPQPKPVVHKPAVHPKPHHRVVTVRSTAYTAHCSEGCTGKTATGINLDANPNIKLIAVDPDVIPLGKRVYVEGYGYAITGDTAGAIHRNKIDIYMAREHDALNWGVRTIKVTILD